MLYLVKPGPDPQTVAVLEEALMRAKAGEIGGVSMSYWVRGQGEDHVVSGLYQDRPAEAVRAALRASMILTRMAEERCGRTR